MTSSGTGGGFTPSAPIMRYSQTGKLRKMVRKGRQNLRRSSR